MERSLRLVLVSRTLKLNPNPHPLLPPMLSTRRFKLPKSPSLISPFMATKGVNPLTPRLSPNRLSQTPLPSPQRRGKGASIRRIPSLVQFKPGCGRFFHKCMEEGWMVPAPAEPGDPSFRICCHQLLDLQGIYTPCGSSGLECDWRPFAFPIAFFFQSTFCVTREYGPSYPLQVRKFPCSLGSTLRSVG